MKKLMLVEDHTSFIKQLHIALREFGDEYEVLELDGVEALKKGAQDKAFFDDLELALVDLELGPGLKKGPQDFDGRDEVLPLVRDRSSATVLLGCLSFWFLVI